MSIFAELCVVHEACVYSFYTHSRSYLVTKGIFFSISFFTQLRNRVVK